MTTSPKLIMVNTYQDGTAVIITICAGGAVQRERINHLDMMRRRGLPNGITLGQTGETITPQVNSFLRGLIKERISGSCPVVIGNDVRTKAPDVGGMVGIFSHNQLTKDSSGTFSVVCGDGRSILVPTDINPNLSPNPDSAEWNPDIGNIAVNSLGFAQLQCQRQR